MGSKWAVLGVGLAACWATSAQATDDALLKKLVDKGVLTQQEADELKQEMSKEEQASYEKFDKVKVASWIDKINLYGDFRLRSDYISQEDELKKADRLRWRYRLRLGAEAKLQGWADVGVRLASGETSPGNPSSANATETGTFSKKPINIDAAFVRIHPPALQGLQAIGGKFDPITWFPSLNSAMIYDPDLTVEGVGEQLSYPFGDSKQFRIFANAQQMALHEFANLERDTYMYDSQGGFQANLNPVTFTVAGGYYLTQNLGASDSSGATALGDGSNKGNSTTLSVVKGKTNSVYLADFGVVYGAAEAVWTIRKEPVLGTPAVLKLGGMYLKNLESKYENDPAGNATDGWTVQATFGDAKRKGNWFVAYQYKRLEANSTFDTITDDDFGNGGTDREGHVVKAAYNVFDWWQLGFTAFVTEKISSLGDRPNSGHNQVGVPGQDHLHLMVDSMVKF